MGIDNPITNELQRQYSQGFLEEKLGLVNSQLSFYIKIRNEFGDLSPKLGIELSGLVYREPSDNTNFGQDGRSLRNLPSSDYEIFHNTVRGIARFIGEEGIARSPIFTSNSEEWSWKGGEKTSLEEALKIYRYGRFSYTAPSKTKVIFQADRNPNKITGDLSIIWKLTNTENINTILHNMKDSVHTIHKLHLNNMRDFETFLYDIQSGHGALLTRQKI